MSLVSDGIVLEGSSTTAKLALFKVMVPDTSEAALTIGSDIFTASLAPISPEEALVNGKTLSVGGDDVTVDGQTVSLASNWYCTWEKHSHSNVTISCYFDC